MVRVKILTPFFAEQTSTHYTKDAEISVPNDLAERHGENGTQFIKVLEDQSEIPKEKSEPVATKPPKQGKGK